MELIQAIALLCHFNASNGYTLNEIHKHQVRCQQEYLHCVSVKRIKTSEKEALEKCLLEK